VQNKKLKKQNKQTPFSNSNYQNQLDYDKSRKTATF